ncbi:MAG: nucleoside triphosphate pyrophosphohydrolase [Anaerolineales bacterium]
MGSITIVGLGPGAPEQLTREAWQVLSETPELWLRTTHHPVVADLPPGLRIHSFDALYERADSFQEVYRAIAAEVLTLGRREEGCVYGVPGHPLVGEAAAMHILRGAEQAEVPVRVVAGLSFIEPMLTALRLDALDGLQTLDALAVADLHHPPFNPDLPALIAQIYNRRVASALKLTLMNQYPDDHEVALVDAGGTPAERVAWLPLFAVDRQPLGALTSLYVPPLGSVSSFEGFQETIARLRAPEGCPWDREQTHESLRTNLLEEAYEVLESIDRDEPEALREELGDLLLQIVLHAQIATELGEFQMAEVIRSIDEKIKHRHPHVWGEVEVADAEEVSLNWETLKRQERETQGREGHSLLASVPRTLPALAQAYAYVSRAKHVGFDWPTLEAVKAKVEEEIRELEAARDAEERFIEMGDLLLAVANWARWLGVEPESALREANARFAQRFQHVEEAARQGGVPLEELGVEELLQLWDAAKGALAE